MTFPTPSDSNITIPDGTSVSPLLPHEGRGIDADISEKASFIVSRLLLIGIDIRMEQTFFIEETIARAIQAERDAKWQPIKGQPEKGARMLISDGNFVVEAVFSPKGSIEDIHGNMVAKNPFPWEFLNYSKRQDVCDVDGYGISDPTHWMPIPSPPHPTATGEDRSMNNLHPIPHTTKLPIAAFDGKSVTPISKGEDAVAQRTVEHVVPAARKHIKRPGAQS